MKAAVILILCLTAMPCTLAVKEDEILNFLEEFRLRMCHPIPKFNLPALDPFEIAHSEVEVNNDYLVDFSASVTNFKLTGLSDFVINDLQISISALKPTTIIFNVTLPLTAFKSLYTCYGSLAYIFRFAGNGDAEASVENFTLAISLDLNTIGGLAISNLQIDISIGSIFINFETLIEEPRINDFFHALINELGLELMHDIWEVEQEIVENMIEEKINSVLNQYTLAEIIEIITGSSGGTSDPIFGPDDPPADCKDTKREIHPLLRLKQQN